MEPLQPAPAAAPAARRMIALGVGSALLSCLFVLSFGYALHSPRPHDVRISVAAPAPVVRAVQVALDRRAPGGFDLHRVADAGRARRAVTDTTSAGALVVPASGPVEIFLASAGGASLGQAVTTALSGVAHAQGRTARVVDVVPLPPGDRMGQSSFALELALLVPSLIGSVGLYLLGRRSRLWIRVAVGTGYAGLAAGLGVLVLDAGFGALTGSPWTLVATAALVAWVFVLAVAALHALFGMAGTAIAAGALLIVGNAVSGASVALPLLPDGYRQIAPWLPNSAAVRAFRDDVYFHDHGLARPLLTLAAWLVVSLAVLVAADIVHLRRRRRAPHRHAQIHAAPMLSGLLAGRGAR